MNQNFVTGKLSAGALTVAITMIAAIGALLALAPTSEAAVRSSVRLADGAVQTTYTVGPIDVTPGQNRIAYKPITGTEKPSVDGYITRIQPNLTYGNGQIPLSSKVMFHHGVWLNASRKDATTPGLPERFYATGEEKTNLDLPPGYGYRYKASDGWILNHMIHNLTPEAMTLFITYTVDFIPDSAPQAAGMKAARPIWMDVDNGSSYPVFDVFRDSGGEDGKFTYPQDANNPYGNGPQKNKWTVDRDGVLLGTVGHVHTGGLDTELFLSRDGASYQGPTCEPPASFEAQLAGYAKSLKKLTAKQKKVAKSMKTKKFKRLRKNLPRKKFKKLKRAKLKRLASLKKQKKRKQAGMAAVRKRDEEAKAVHQACVDTQPNVTGNRVRLFQSEAHYFGNRPPISWDVAMLGTAPNWRVAVKKGDVLDLQTTYETKIASWPESMGINITYMADGETDGADPYKTKVDQKGVLNHGHYEENNDHGGTEPLVGPDPSTLPDGLASGGPFQIGDYSYQAGDFRLPGAAGRPPVVKQGQSFTFKLSAADQATETWHSLTSCKSPCNKSTGISYPIADGDFQFESGQLGLGGPPTVNRDTWTTPANMPVGTHTYFCRIHPLMRGAFRVVK